MNDPAADAPRPTIIGRALDLVDRRINPVLLRDLRLYMRGKFMLAAYFLTLAGLILTAALYAVIARYDQTDGVDLLRLLTSALAVICGALIPNLAFERFRSELANRATELALASPLTPARLVRGKLLGVWCVTLLAISAAAPMLATAYLLGGVNLLGLLGATGGVLLAGLALPALQLSMAADFKGGKGLSRGLAALLFVVEFVMMLFYASLLHRTFVRPSSRPERDYLAFACLAVAGVLIGQFLYFNTVGILRGEAESRDIAPRLSLSLATALGALCAMPIHLYLTGVGSGFGLTAGRAASLAICLDACAFCLGFTGVCQSSPAPARNLREKWRRRPFRSLLLLPGVNSLAAYFLLHAAALLGLLTLVLRFSGGEEDFWGFLGAALAAFMAIAYGLAAYYYLILPLARDKRNPKLLSYSIGLVNIALALAAVFTNVLISYVLGKDEMYTRILGLTPVGLITAGLQGLAPDAVPIGLVATGLLGLLLLGIAADVRRTAESGGDHAPR